MVSITHGRRRALAHDIHAFTETVTWPTVQSAGRQVLDSVHSIPAWIPCASARLLVPPTSWRCLPGATARFLLQREYHAPAPASWYPLPPGALYRGPHHDFKKA
ncbi:hypothetical protein FE257_006686 [Aspergillus nanangensis]|uniref:Uncharacterized protein n=1 Tax=Aspergillus nanangensis TaxID=2582783 RepID=A0AAD4GUR8_ASPNN|nr:hypothetical protein FE257_006686 [Aspergillus nanangensis]